MNKLVRVLCIVGYFIFVNLCECLNSNLSTCVDVAVKNGGMSCARRTMIMKGFEMRTHVSPISKMRQLNFAYRGLGITPDWL